MAVEHRPEMAIRRSVFVSIVFLFAGAALIMTILSIVLCDFLNVELPTVTTTIGTIDGFVGSAGLTASCRPDIPYMGGVKYSSAFAMAACSAIIGFGCLIIVCSATTVEYPIAVSCGLAYGFFASALLEGMTFTLFGNWECDEGTCTLGVGAGLAIGATLLWVLCCILACAIPVRIQLKDTTTGSTSTDQ